MAESAPWTFCQNNTVMLTYSHNHAPGILLWQCSCHRNEKQNSESFFNYDANLTSVITMELKFIFFSFRCWFLCMTSIAVSSSLLKTAAKFWGTSFKFWLRPWNLKVHLLVQLRTPTRVHLKAHLKVYLQVYIKYILRRCI